MMGTKKLREWVRCRELTGAERSCSVIPVAHFSTTPLHHPVRNPCLYVIHHRAVWSAVSDAVLVGSMKRGLDVFTAPSPPAAHLGAGGAKSPARGKKPPVVAGSADPAGGQVGAGARSQFTYCSTVLVLHGLLLSIARSRAGQVFLQTAAGDHAHMRLTPQRRFCPMANSPCASSISDCLYRLVAGLHPICCPLPVPLAARSLTLTCTHHDMCLPHAHAAAAARYAVQ